MIEIAKEMIKDILKDDELFDLSAKVIWKSYSALRNNGFDHDSAILMVANQGSLVKGSN
jgi:hypothetical protein